MRRVKHLSIQKYITASTTVLVFVMLVVMLVFINILANMAINYDIRNTLSKEILKNSKNVEYIDGEFVPKEEFQAVEDGRYFLILKNKEGVCLGTYPPGFSMESRMDTKDVRLIKQNNDAYYVFDRVCVSLTKETGKTIFGRCVVKRSDIDSEYRTLKNMSYVSIPVFLVLVSAAGILISKRISEPLRQMCTVAENIGKDDDLSQRMQYDGRFEEIAILTDTNNRMLDRLEQMYESQKQFNSDVAHELRTPLSVLLAQCEYAKGHSGDEEEMQRTFDVIGRQVQKCNRIVCQLLQLRKLEQHQVILDLEDADIDEIVEAVCEDEEMKAEGQVDFRLKLGGISAKVDVILMMSLIQNLVNNAVKYSKTPAVVEIITEKGQNEIRISVKDYGCGIPKEELKNVFVPFYRIEKARNSEGFGLGLSLVERIAQVHGGKITVESEVGKGSCFTLRLPV